MNYSWYKYGNAKEGSVKEQVQTKRHPSRKAQKMPPGILGKRFR